MYFRLTLVPQTPIVIRPRPRHCRIFGCQGGSALASENMGYGVLAGMVISNSVFSVRPMGHTNAWPGLCRPQSILSAHPEVLLLDICT